jgi:two-component system phosphate regulon sensor histidine kinase PhoR
MAHSGHLLWSFAGFLGLLVSGWILFRLPEASERPGSNPGAVDPAWEGTLGASILSQLKEGVLFLGPDNRLGLYNPAAETLLGGSSRMVAKVDVIEVFREPESLRCIAAAREGFLKEWTLRRDPRILRVRAVPLDPAEVPAGVIVTLDDVTRLEALETTRQKFISNASHELKTPVTSIRIAAEGLLDSGLAGPEGASSLQSILRSVDRMTLLLNDISELSRIETGALQLAFADIPLQDFLEDLQPALEEQARAKNIRLEISSAPALAAAVLHADGFRLQQLLENLAGNAIKFSPGGSTVRVTTSLQDPWLRWDVQDQGPGIALSEQKRIFERFYRSPAMRGVPGTGLGLAIVKHLAVHMGGEVQLRSNLGEGSTFTLLLPRTLLRPTP